MVFCGYLPIIMDTVQWPVKKALFHVYQKICELVYIKWTLSVVVGTIVDTK